MRKYLRIAAIISVYGVTGIVALGGLFAGGYYYVAPTLPQAEELRDIRLQIPLSVYSRDGRLMALFGEKQRTPARFEDVPPVLVQAVLAAEDDRFFDHPGFDYQGYMRAVTAARAAARSRSRLRGCTFSIGTRLLFVNSKS